MVKRKPIAERDISRCIVMAGRYQCRLLCICFSRIELKFRELDLSAHRAYKVELIVLIGSRVRNIECNLLFVANLLNAVIVFCMLRNL